MFDIWLPSWAAVVPGLLVAMVLLSEGRFGWAGLTALILTPLFALAVMAAFVLPTEGEPLPTAVLAWCLFLICCWYFRKPVHDDDTVVALSGFFGVVSPAIAVFALI